MLYVGLVLRQDRQCEPLSLSLPCDRWGVPDWDERGKRLVHIIEGNRYIMRRKEVQGVTIPAEDNSEFGVADAYGFGEHCFKHRLKIAGRATDNLEHLRGGSLLLLAPLVALACQQRNLLVFATNGRRAATL